MLTGSVSRFAKSVSGLDQNKPGIQNSMNKIMQFAMQEKAEDTFGALAAGMQIRVLALVITCFLWSTFVGIVPSSFKTDIIPPDQKKITETQTEDDKKAEEDIIDIIMNLIKMLAKCICVAGGGFYAVKRIQNKRKKEGQSAMDIAIEEEMARLREAIEKKESGAGGVGADGKQKFSTSLDGVTLVELFNSFAEIMAIRGDLPRVEDETALEYFRRIATEIKFSKGKAEMASRYFEDELYGQHETTEENRKAFLELILSMMERVKPGKKIA